MIAIQQVVKTFKNAAGEFTVLKGVDLTIEKGQFVAIIGKSGSGKSTLLNMMTGIDRPTAGKVFIGATDLYAMSESKRSLWRGKNMGIVFQFFQLLPMLTLLENVMLPMDYVGMYDVDERPRRALELLTLVGLEKQAGKLPLAVSTGQQQLAALARALANDPPLLVADEPTGNLDTRTADIVIELFQHFAEQGKTVVMVTHDPSLTERTSRTIIISDGEVVNETLAQAFPLLSHRQMLALTKQSVRQTVAPGKVVLSRDQHVDQLYIVVSGQAEVSIERKKHASAVARLAAGEFFGEVELLRGGKAVATVCAAPDASLELLAIPHEALLAALKDSPLTEAALTRIVQHRVGDGK
ncbi:ATP-binding cassette domain-containing protein [bacterium]|nr:ATP-binding cassette domain-containing protein [bacterium]NCT20364.1 ATP-binding cassette domain-containing protein [bacterium]OIO87336.1 MAG: hypothetical protein AUK01_00440 [Anaerolineae bacterium CG2_30_57_67]